MANARTFFGYSNEEHEAGIAAEEEADRKHGSDDWGMQRPSDVAALQQAIKDGEATTIMNMVREMDEIVRLLEIADSFDKPSDVIRRLISFRKAQST